MKAIEVSKYLYAIPALVTAVVIPEVEATIVYTSTAVSIIGVATGAFTKDTWITAGSLCLGAINIVLWKNYGAAAKNRGFKEGFEHGAKQEEEEGRSLDKVLQKTRELEREREGFQKEVQRLALKNSAVTADLQIAKNEIQTLQGQESSQAEQVKQLNLQVIAQKKEILKREQIENEQHAEISHLHESVIAISKTATGLKDYIIEKEGEIETLKGRIRDLTEQLSRSRR